MNKVWRFLVVFLLYAVFPGMPGSAFDFGLVIGQSGGVGTTGSLTNTNPANDDAEFNYTGTYSPWFSSELGTTTRLYLSAKLSTIYKAPPLLIELERTEFTWRPLPAVYLEAGRIRFQDPSGMIAAGLFDGASGSIGMDKTRLSMGVFYTGLLYKETTKIMMTSTDADAYTTLFTFDDPDSYFASKRIVVSLGAEFGDLTPRTSLAVNVLAQFDVNDSDVSAGSTTLHTQYFDAKYTALPLEVLTVTGTAVMGLAESRGNDPMFHFAAAAALDWEVPGALRDLAQMELRWSSGRVNERIAAFVPINSIVAGQVFTPKISGVMTIRGAYTARFQQNLSVAVEGTYFIRTDGETLSGADYPPSAITRALGGELYGSLLWVPKSDLVLTLGGGAFFPGMGDVFNSGSPVQWKINAGIILSL